MRMRDVVCVAVAVATAGCRDRPEPIETGMLEARDAGRAMIRVVHAAPGAGELSVYRIGTEAAGGLRYLDVTPWVTVPAGEGGLELIAGRRAGHPVAELGERLEPGRRYTVVAYGDGGEPELRLLEEPEPPEPGRVRLGVLNLIDDGPEVELYVRGGRDRLLDDVEPGELEAEDVAPTRRALEFRREGERAPYLLVARPELSAGSRRLLVLTGTEERPDLVELGEGE